MRPKHNDFCRIIAPLIVTGLILIGCSGGGTGPQLSNQSSTPVIQETSGPAPANTPTQAATDTPFAPDQPVLAAGVLYQDDFTDPDSGWPSLEFDNAYIGYHEPEYYHVEVHQVNDRALVPLQDQLFSDFTAEVEVFAEPDITATEGNFRYGLVFRRSGDQYYALVVSPVSKKWFVLKSTPSGLEVLAEGGNETIQGLEGADKLRVDAKGPTFSFQINDQSIGQVEDPDYAGGETGFFVQTFDNPQAHIHYDLLTIRELQSIPLVEDVIYQDDFTDPDSGWPSLEFDNAYIGYHEPEYYHVEVHQANDRALVPLQDQRFGDFTAEVEVFAEPDITATEGNFRYGLVFRRSGDQYYALVVSPVSKEWFVLKSTPSGLEVLAEDGNETIQGLEGADKLRVDVKGSTFSFQINDQSIGQVQDPDYADGEIGFFVQTLDNPQAHIHYDLLTIREVQAPEPTPAPTVPPGMYVRINQIDLEDGHYVVHYETFEYTETLPGMHVHFFFDTVSQENAGVPGSGPWILYGGPRPFREYRLSDRPPDASQMCALVANPDHSIHPDSGNCVDLPESP